MLSSASINTRLFIAINRFSPRHFSGWQTTQAEVFHSLLLQTLKDRFFVFLKRFSHSASKLCLDFMCFIPYPLFQNQERKDRFSKKQKKTKKTKTMPKKTQQKTKKNPKTKTKQNTQDQKKKKKIKKKIPRPPLKATTKNKTNS